MRTKPALAAATAALALAVTPSALAHDYCVADASCVSAGGTDKVTVEAALSAANGTIEADRVLIGPGTFTAPTTSGFKAELSPVEIIGSGAGSTTLTAPAGTAVPLNVDYPGSRVAALGIRVPAANGTNATKIGVRALGATAERLHISADAGAGPVTIGADLSNGSVLQDSTIELPVVGPNYTAVDLASGSSARRNVLTARHGIAFQGAHLRADHNRIYATDEGIDVMNSATDNVASDSVIQIATDGYGVSVGDYNGTDAGIELRGLTIVGDGTPGSVGVAVSSIKGHVASVVADSTIVRGFDHSIDRAALSPGEADVNLQYSDIDTGTALESGAGAITIGPGNVSANPLFAGGGDFHLLAGSPVTDAGDPADLGDAEDLDGSARVIDGDGDGIARRDMGAFEVPPAPASGLGGADAGSEGQPGAATTAPRTVPAPFVSLMDRTAPMITRLRSRRGPRITFNLSEYALVRVVISRRSSAAGLRRVGALKRALGVGPAKMRVGRIGRTTLRPGSYVARLTAVDAARNRSRSYSVRFNVVRP